MTRGETERGEGRNGHSRPLHVGSFVTLRSSVSLVSFPHPSSFLGTVMSDGTRDVRSGEGTSNRPEGREEGTEGYDSYLLS